MAVKVKPGMHCERCDKPVAAQKQTHKARSILTTPLIGAAGWKVGEWHCPECGGPVVAEWQAERRARKRKEEAAQSAAEKASQREVAGASEILVRPTKKKVRLTMALSDAGLTGDARKAAERSIQAGESFRVRPTSDAGSAKFVSRLRSLGVTYRLFYGESDEAEQPRGSAPATAGIAVTALPEAASRRKRAVDGLRRGLESRFEGAPEDLDEQLNSLPRTFAGFTASNAQVVANQFRARGGKAHWVRPEELSSEDDRATSS